MSDEAIKAHVYKFDSWLMDILDSINFDKEAMLEGLVEQSGLSPEEFGVYFILEEYPIEIHTTQDISFSSNSIKVTQEFKVRPRTPEEMQLSIETGDTDD